MLLARAWLLAVLLPHGDRISDLLKDNSLKGDIGNKEDSRDSVTTWDKCGGRASHRSGSFQEQALR